MRLIFTPLAASHIDTLHDFIASRSSVDRADGYIDRIVTFCVGLAAFPHRGTARDDIFPGLRVIGFERRVTSAFSVTADALVAEGIFYGGRDFAALLARS